MSRTKGPKIRKAPPHEFVLENLEKVGIHTKAMFGALGVYVGDRIVLILRDKETHREDNGVWVVAELEHQESLRADLPSLTGIKMFEEGGPGKWKNIPSSSATFEEEVLKVCKMIARGDSRIGRIPDSRRLKSRT